MYFIQIVHVSDSPPRPKADSAPPKSPKAGGSGVPVRVKQEVLTDSETEDIVTSSQESKEEVPAEPALKNKTGKHPDGSTRIMPAVSIFKIYLLLLHSCWGFIKVLSLLKFLFNYLLYRIPGIGLCIRENCTTFLRAIR